MIADHKLYNLAKTRFEEAKILLNNNKFDGAIYLCGYALELILKKHIVQALKWEGYPETKSEFENYKSFKTHNLDVLLNLAGLQKYMTSDTLAFARWQIAKNWDSEIRYKEVGKLAKTDAEGIIEATKETINFILRA